MFNYCGCLIKNFFRPVLVNKTVPVDAGLIAVCVSILNITGMKRLLLISNSTNHGETFLSYTLHYLKDFLTEAHLKIAFVPYAAVDISYLEYTNIVNDVFSNMGHTLKSVDDNNSPASVIKDADVIVVGGGNTFRLLHQLHEKGLIDAIRKKVFAGTPYIGWSAGANVACPGIYTTNDMPIVEPESFSALDLVPFQINPHYTDSLIPNHNGESREVRLKEFLHLNPEKIVLGLKEGSILQIEDNNISILGNKTVKVFRHNLPTLEYDANSSLDFVLEH
jgi:dipeptidase E